MGGWALSNTQEAAIHGWYRLNPVNASKAVLGALSGNACFIHLPTGSFKKELGFFKKGVLWYPPHLSEHEFVASRKVACDAILQDDIADDPCCPSHH